MERRRIMNRKEISPSLAIGDQPTEADLEALKREGYVGVVNLRQDGEPEQPLSTAAEGERVRALGMDYLHYGVGGVPLTEAGVGAVCDFLDRHATGKVLVHCRKGPRAAALVLLQRARAEGWSPAEALARGEQMGLKVEGGLRQLVEAYLAGQHGRA
jgi:uncharacterized protein (TIGR01244 family)